MARAALVLLAVLASAARAAIAPNRSAGLAPIVANMQPRASAAPLCRAGARCRHTASSPQEFYFEVNGEQVIMDYLDEKHFLVWCDSDRFSAAPVAADEPALPALPRRAAVDRVEFRGCRLPRGSFAAAMAALNVSTTKTLELMVSRDDLLLERSHMSNLSVASLVIEAYAVKTERDFLNDVTGLQSLQMFGVRLTAEALQRLPDTLTRLILHDALGAEPSGSLQWLERLRSLRMLTLMERSATGPPLTPPALSLFRNLTSLILQVPLTVPPHWLNGSSLNTLSLSSCGLKNLPSDMFEGVNLTSLNLSRNNLSSLPVGLISSQRWLATLDVSGAALSGAALARLAGPLGRLRRLRASDNPLGSLCDDNSYASKTKSLLPRSLEQLQLRRTGATVVCADWVDEASALSVLDLSFNNISVLDYGSLKMLRTPSRLRGDGVSLQLAGNPLGDVLVAARDLADCRAAPAPAPDVLSRVLVRLTLSSLPCDCGSAQLRRLLRECALVRLQGDAQCAPAPPAPAPRTLLAHRPERMLCPCAAADNFTVPGCSCGKRVLDNATVVNCTRAIPSGIRWPPANRTHPLVLHMAAPGLAAVPREALLELHAVNNSIDTLDARDINETLLVLDLRNNNIAHLSAEVVRQLGVAGPGGAPRRVWLGGNPLACECADRDAIASLKSAKVQEQLQDWKELRCHDGREISALTPSELCPSPLLPALAGVASVVLVLVLLASYLLRWARPRLKQFLFDRQLCLSWVMHAEDAADDPHKTHDVFISYAHPDRKLADRLLRWLEECGYSTVEHSRDWHAGVSVAQQITHSVMCARRTLLLVTDSFVKSEWGLQEFHAAHAHALERGSARVIPVRCALSAPNELPDDLRRYLYNNTYLSWDDPDFWSKLLRVMPPRRSKAVPTRPVVKEPPLAEQITPATDAEYAPAAC